jgi:hypothetical protein
MHTFLRLLAQMSSLENNSRSMIEVNGLEAVQTIPSDPDPVLAGKNCYAVDTCACAPPSILTVARRIRHKI